MLDLVLNNIPTILICTGLLALVIGIIRSLIKDKKQGKTFCGGSCSSCAGCGICHNYEIDPETEEKINEIKKHLKTSA